MRELLLIAVLAAGLVATLRYPFVGIILWAWFSLMTPHQLAYSLLPLNFAIAAVTIAALAVHGEFRNLRFDAITGWLVALSAWLFISQWNSLDPDNSAIYFDRFIKTLLFVIICAQAASSRLRVHALLWMLAVALGFFAVKGALFTAATFGQYRVQGIEQTILEDNNHMGIALATVLPLLIYLRGEARHGWVRAGVLGVFFMTVFAIIGTQSRGAFISLLVFAGYFWMRSRRKLMLLAAAAALALPAIAFMPSEWRDRMQTITSAAEDDSFMGRVDAWIINTKFALERPLTGAGLRNPYQPALAAKIDPDRAERAKAAHSIYFEMLGGAGFVGLALYLGLLGSAFLAALRLSHERVGAANEPWTTRFGYYAQISLATFFVGGASTSMEMWDGYLLVIALVAASARIAAADSASESKLAAPFARFSWRAAARGRPSPRPRSI